MAMAQVDASIPLSVKPVEPVSIDFAGIQNMQEVNMRMQALRDKTQAQNQLKNLFASPGAVDASGNLTDQALQKVMALDPETGLEIRKQQLAIGEVNLKRYGEIQDIVSPVRDASIYAYDQAKKSGAGEEAAVAAGQAALTEGLKSIQSGGLMSDGEKANLRTKFEYAPMFAQSVQAQKRKEDDRREAFQENVETKKLGFEAQRVGLEGAHLALARQEANQRMALTGMEIADRKNDPTRLLKQDAVYRGDQAVEVAEKAAGRKFSPAEAAAVRDPVLESVLGEKGYTAQPGIGKDADGKDVAGIYKIPKAGTANPEFVPGVALTGKSAASLSPEQQDNIQQEAKDIAEYRKPPYTGRGAQTPYAQAVNAAVDKQNPEYDATQYHARNKAMDAFASGKKGDTIRSLNVSISHLDTFADLAKALQNGDLQGLNSVGQKIASFTGGTAPTNFDAAKGIVGDEIVKAIIGGGGSLTDREEAKATLSRAESPEQLAGVIETYKDLLAGQMGGLRKQYEDTTGLKNFDNRLEPATRAALARRGNSSGGFKGGDTPSSNDGWSIQKVD